MKKLSLLLVSALLISGLSASAVLPVQAEKFDTSDDPYIPPVSAKSPAESEAAVNAAGCTTCGAKFNSSPILQGNSYSNALPDGYTAAPAGTTPAGAEGTK
jgi:hypothetical protein